MTKIFGIMAMMLAFSASAGVDLVGSTTMTTCFAPYGEGYSWMVVKIVEDEVENNPNGFISATVSVPYGPRGTYISQNYIHIDTEYFRLSRSSFQKVGTPTGINADAWSDWFPENLVMLSSYRPLYIGFKGGEFLQLDCK